MGHLSRTLVILSTALACTVAAQAAASRTFVSTTGNDANVSVNCSASANCRSFGAAISVTLPGGEVVVLNSGGYGPASILEPIVITALGIDAAISVTTSGQDALTINTPGNVTLRGLNLHGEFVGANGISVLQVSFLRLYDLFIENFSDAGVNFNVAGMLSIYDSEINDNVTAGLILLNANAIAYVSNSSFDHNGQGVEIFAGKATVADSDAHYNTSAGFKASGTGTLTLYNDRSIFNGLGLSTTTTGTLYFARSLISNNNSGYNIAGGTTMAGTSPATSLIAPGQALTGTLASPVTLQ